MILIYIYTANSQFCHFCEGEGICVKSGYAKLISMKKWIKIYDNDCNAVTYRATGLEAVFYIYFGLLEHS